MVKKHKDTLADPIVSELTMETEVKESPAFGMIPGYVRIVNLKPSARDIMLRDGTNIHLGPYGRGDHTSVPIPKAQIPLFDRSGKPIVVGKMIQRGEIRLEVE